MPRRSMRAAPGSTSSVASSKRSRRRASSGFSKRFCSESVALRDQAHVRLLAAVAAGGDREDRLAVAAPVLPDRREGRLALFVDAVRENLRLLEAPAVHAELIGED